MTDFCYSAWDSRYPLQKHYTVTAVTQVSENTEGEIVPNILKSQKQSALNWVPQINDTQEFFLFASVPYLVKGNNATSPLDCYEIILCLWSVWIA